jgi:diguanylate cyclase (GGDEF)-like protein/PAS domain S-box-containing protein
LAAKSKTGPLPGSPISAETVEWAENSSEIVLVVDQGNRLIYLNPPAAELLNSKPQALLGSKMEEIFDISFAARWKARMQNPLHSDQPDYFESLVRTKNGSKWLGTGLTPLENAQGEIVSTLGISRDISQTKLVERQLRGDLEELTVLAQMDTLTGLGNRSAIQQRAEAELSRAKRSKSNLCFALVDIDNLKEINDTLGHLAGDEALKITGTKIRSVLRSYDFAGRWGGDEFLIIIPGPNIENAQKIGERLCQIISSETYHLASEAEFTVTVSVGLACLSGQDESSTSDDLFAKADKALYEAKQLGGSRSHVFDT